MLSALTAVFNFQRTLLTAARGRPIADAWVGPCTPQAFLRMVRDLSTLMLRQDASGVTVLAEHLPLPRWDLLRLRRGDERWAMRSIGERLRLLRAIVALLCGCGRSRTNGARGASSLIALWAVMSTDQRDAVHEQARRWPGSMRHRIAQLPR